MVKYSIKERGGERERERERGEGERRRERERVAIVMTSVNLPSTHAHLLRRNRCAHTQSFKAEMLNLSCSICSTFLNAYFGAIFGAEVKHDIKYCGIDDTSDHFESLWGYCVYHSWTQRKGEEGRGGMGRRR